MFRRHFFLAAAVGVLILMAIGGALKLATAREGEGGARAAAGAPPGGGPGGGILISAVAAQPRTFADTIEVLGVAKGRQSVTLTAAATQLVERVRFQDGQFVQRGEILVELKDTEQSAEEAQAEARLVQAGRTYDRYRQLAERGYASKAAVDQYEAAYKSALADVQAARARRLDRLIRAPFSGVVGLSDVAPGALVNPGAPIVTLDDLSSVRVDFQVPERFLAQLREGQRILATADAYPGETITGRIARLDTRIDERTRAITARAEFPNPDRRLKPGMLVRVGVTRGVRQSVSAPESAVAVQGANAFVYVVRRTGERTIAEQRSVVTGLRQQGYVEIREGLEAGERIVADGLNKIQPGMRVQVAAAQRGVAAQAGSRPPA